jgi:hypothetical protein
VDSRAASFDAGTITLYVNCQPVSEKTSTTITHTELAEYTYDNLRIGNSRTNVHFECAFIGAIDEVRFYKRVLSGAEICRLARTYTYPPIVMAGCGSPPDFPLHISDAVAKRPAAYQGEVFFSQPLTLPDPLPIGGEFYLSSQAGSQGLGGRSGSYPVGRCRGL